MDDGRVADSGRGPDSALAGSPQSCLDLTDRTDAARLGRLFVAEQVTSRGAPEFVDDACVVGAELIANARQHGSAPVIVCVSGQQDRVRIEVRDGSSRLPVQPGHSTSNMTGRGLTLIHALSTTWGVERHPEGGKVVWAELDGSPATSPDRDLDVERIFARWEDEDPAAEQRFTVVLGNVSTDLLIDAKAHVDNLVREFSLASAGAQVGQVGVPMHLANLIEAVINNFGDARDAIKRQALAASKRGDLQTTLTLHLPVSAAEAGEAYLAALDEADEFSRAARLLTLETPPDHRLFRRWYVGSVVRQLRQLAKGETPVPARTFEEELAREVRRLSTSQRVSQRAARLQRVTAALARARTPEDVAGVVVSVGVDTLNASGGGVLVPAGDGQHLAVPGVVGYEARLVDALREERLDAPLPAATALRTSRAIWLESQEDRDREFPALRGFEAATVSMCAVPLIVGDRALGALRFSFDRRRLFDEDERAFVLALAALTGQTLLRTEMYEAEREATLNLQRALLPAEMPVIDGWEIASYYSPAGDQEAGGDFYDVLEVSNGRVVAVVGDVMGRGLEAAASMAAIRSAIRAYAIDDPDPVRVFERTDRLFDVLNPEQLVTALYLLIDPETGDTEIVNAGHLPPLLVGDGGSEAVETVVGTPFGVSGEGRASVTIRVRPGASLVAVTDGLVERRGEDIDEGIARVLAAARQAPTNEAGPLLKRLVAAAATNRIHDDDVTVLVLHRP
jgi:serine phosphatase RsbU (regulator of sigma subunit)